MFVGGILQWMDLSFGVQCSPHLECGDRCVFVCGIDGVIDERGLVIAIYKIEPHCSCLYFIDLMKGAQRFVFFSFPGFPMFAPSTPTHCDWCKRLKYKAGIP